MNPFKYIKTRTLARSLYVLTFGMVSSICLSVAEVEVRPWGGDVSRFLGPTVDCENCSAGNGRDIIGEVPMPQTQLTGSQAVVQSLVGQRPVSQDPFTQIWNAASNLPTSQTNPLIDVFNSYNAAQSSVFGTVQWPQPQQSSFERMLYGQQNTRNPFLLHTIYSTQDASAAFFQAMRQPYSFLLPQYQPVFIPAAM